MVGTLPFYVPMGFVVFKSTSIKSNENASWVPDSPGEPLFPQCGTQIHTSSHNNNIAPWMDCLGIQDWARHNAGEWELHGQNDLNNVTDWTVLTKSGNCALLVKHTLPTIIGSSDVDSLLEKIWYDSGTQMGQVEEVGQLKACHTDVDVTFWLRDAVDL
ncbi:hypothetical protein F5B20DRAFT_339976 [Whalleya microplaca]|nr:hypothetical protein F5B20DRAFT_339976 [Whalleya microplaca]